MGSEFAEAITMRDRFDKVAARMGQSPAILYRRSASDEQISEIFTFDAFVSSIRQRSHALRSLGINPSSVVSAMMPLSALSYQTVSACLCTGAFAPLNYFLEAEALIQLITESGATHLLAASVFDDDPRAFEKLATIRRALPFLKVISFGPDAGAADAIDLEALAARQPDDCWPDDPLIAEPARRVAILHTGGTTGLPKLVPHTDRMYRAAVEIGGLRQGHGPGDTIMGGLPLFHTSGLLNVGLIPLLAGTTVVIPSSRGYRDPHIVKNLWRDLAAFNISTYGSVPTIVQAITAAAEAGRTAPVQKIISGAAPLPVTFIRKLNEFGIELIEGWGMTETCGFSVLNLSGETRTGAVGKPYPGVEIQIRKQAADGDPMMVPCAADEIGELVIRGDMVITDYYTPRTNSHTPDGWLLTGDLGRIDADGYLWITGRLKDIIIRGGHNIDPGMIEDAAYGHEAVQLAAAVGRPDRHAGELPVLYVQLKPGASATEAELLDFITPRIQERAALPKAVYIRDSIPLSGPGKVSKLLLRYEAARQLFQAELDDHFGIGKFTVDVREDRLSGAVALVYARDSDSARLEAQIAELLNGFSLKHKFIVKTEELA